MKMDRRHFLGVSATVALAGCRSPAPDADPALPSRGR
jgi:hypothetical protein